MRRKLKRSTRQYLIVAVICIIIIGSAAVLTSIIITNQIRDEYKSRIDKAYQDMKNNQRSIYVAAKDISSGGYITADNVIRKTVYDSQPEKNYIKTEEIGKVALVDIPAGTHILNTMVTDNAASSALREIEYNVIGINSNIVSNDTVDIRILYPNGENYIVLSKKNILGMKKESQNCYFHLSEEEIQLMSSAIVDAYLYKGTKLYTAKYIEPGIQDASVVTYTPSLATINLIKNNPNIIKIASQYLSSVVRKELENRLALSSSQDVTKTEWDTDSNQTSDEQQMDIPSDIEPENKAADENYYYEEEKEDRKEDREYGE